MRKLFLWVILVGCGLNMMAQSWPEVRTEAKPASRWWWLGSAVDSVNLRYNMEAYAKAGLGGLEITPIYGVQGNDANNLSFLSPEWMQMLNYTEKEGKRLGIEVDMNTGTGWPFGGPEVTIEDAATKAHFQTYKVSEKGQIALDITISDEKQLPYAHLSRVMAYSDQGKCLNLTSKANNNILHWNVPEGEWQVVVLYIAKTFQKVKRAAPGGEGYVMDHFSKGAVSRYFSKFDRAFEKSGTPYPHTFFNDSYEVYGADWTPDLLEQFAKRRGYRLEDHFLEFLDESRPETTARIMSDYRETISDLLIENFTTQWTNWAHKKKSITRNQAHGSPSNLIDTYASVDIPECEGFGLSSFHIKGLRQDSLTRHNDSDLSMLKYASSAAHITGKPYTSTETFTWLTEHFRTSLAQCKPDLDLMFVSGVNHIFFHGTPYSPKEAEWPGWLFYASINMSPTNSIWKDAPAFFDYTTRCQSFLQMGKPDNDFLVYLPVYDMWERENQRLILFGIHNMAKRAPDFIHTIHQISESGYDVDYISDQFIRTTKCVDGQLVTSGGISYKAIVLPAVKRIPADVMSHLVNLAHQGATLIFLDHYPQDVPGFGQLESRRNLFSKQIAKLPVISSFEKVTVSPFNKGKIITGNDIPSSLQASGVIPEDMKTQHGLQYIRRSNDNGHHYFISSLQNKGVDAWINLSIPAQSAMLFNPMTGEKGMAQTRQQNGITQVKLQLHSGESTILQSFNHTPENQPVWSYWKENMWSISLDHGWKIRFEESEPSIEGSFDIDTPSSWTTLNHPAATTTMATGIYTITFTMPSLEADEWMLDLGDVRESAKVYVNGKEAGTAWAVPYQIKIGHLLQKGENRLEVHVTNLPANRIAEYDRQEIQWRKFNEINIVNLNYKPQMYGHWEPMPSGLNGTVRLIPLTRE